MSGDRPPPPGIGIPQITVVMLNVVTWELSPGLASGLGYRPAERPRGCLLRYVNTLSVCAGSRFRPISKRIVADTNG